MLKAVVKNKQEYKLTFFNTYLCAYVPSSKQFLTQHFEKKSSEFSNERNTDLFLFPVAAS